MNRSMSSPLSPDAKPVEASMSPHFRTSRVAEWAGARMHQGILLLVLVVIGCGTGDRPTPVAAAATTALPAGYVSRATYGDDWPFSVPSGTLACYPSGNDDGRLLVTFGTGDGIEYALNGQARSFGFPELDETILPSWPDASMLGDLIEQGLALCE